jgi:hypothetical protein
MEKRTLKYISDNQLASCMNTTKWKELVHEITSNEAYEPLVNIKLIFEEENNNSFSPVWWNEVERDGFELIEWLQIQPFKTEKGVRLIDPKQIDYTEFIQKGLDKHAIQYEYENDIFTIYGYIRMK